MMVALDVMPWAAPALLTLLVGTGVILRRGRHARAASVVLGAAAVLAAAWVLSSVVMALRAVA
ncbi:hypothetical protein KPL78_18725 [Roseomonas sp. HJA6]|uniref:Uncharacterized protein n=1 Tax=Roseomonas alba TaxID=2846776 RepID=A0ABS7AC78_9PROT|nr:hypothetical protein [Neoroseomonas alba]MBW6399901.1 hypothetical protein [Neoroseomonas alba]